MITSIGTLEETLHAVADYLELDAEMLCGYALEDTLTGWDFDKGEWPCGSLHTPEGQTLYALVRALKPMHIIEFGTLYGCSAAHLQRAVVRNHDGQVTSIDPLIPNERRLTDGVTYIQTDALRFLSGLMGRVEFIFEDTDHSLETTRAIWQAALPKLVPGGLMISHDPCHEWAGAIIRQAMHEALGHEDYLIVQVPPSDCGLAIYRKPA